MWPKLNGGRRKITRIQLSVSIVSFRLIFNIYTICIILGEKYQDRRYTRSILRSPQDLFPSIIPALGGGGVRARRRGSLGFTNGVVPHRSRTYVSRSASQSKPSREPRSRSLIPSHFLNVLLKRDSVSPVSNINAYSDLCTQPPLLAFRHSITVLSTGRRIRRYLPLFLFLLEER